ncbi:hypothetical protein STEG23_000359 [Scotinomys teguina]
MNCLANPSSWSELKFSSISAEFFVFQDKTLMAFADFEEATKVVHSFKESGEICGHQRWARLWVEKRQHTQLVECCPNAYKAKLLGSIAKITIKPSVVVPTYNPSTQEWRQEDWKPQVPTEARRECQIPWNRSHKSHWPNLLLIGAVVDAPRSLACVALGLVCF